MTVPPPDLLVGGLQLGEEAAATALEAASSPSSSVELVA